MNVRKLVGPRGEGYVVIQFMLFLLIGFGPSHVDGLIGPLFTTLSIVKPVGLLIIALGCAFCLSGIIALGRNLTPYPHPKADATLTQRGAYAIVRHPIYTGLFFLALGWAFYTNSPLRLLYALLLLLFFDIKSRHEEHWLSLKFSTYHIYQKSVRKLIPLIY